MHIQHISALILEITPVLEAWREKQCDMQVKDGHIILTFQTEHVEVDLTKLLHSEGYMFKVTRTFDELIYTIAV